PQTSAMRVRHGMSVALLDASARSFRLNRSGGAHCVRRSTARALDLSPENMNAWDMTRFHPYVARRMRSEVLKIRPSRAKLAPSAVWFAPSGKSIDIGVRVT